MEPMNLTTCLFLAGMMGLGSSLAESVRVYVGTQARGESRGIYLTELDLESGTLSAPKLAAEVASPGFLVMDETGTRLFATSRDPERNGEDSVVGFGVHEDGMLELRNYQSSQGKGPCFVGLDASGSVLMAANYGSGGVAIFPVDPNGTVNPSRSFYQHEGASVNKRRQAGPHAHSIMVGPENKYVYAPDLGIDEVVIYALDLDEVKITPAGVAKMPPGSGPRHMKFGKDGNYAYVLSEMLLTVVVFERATEGGGLIQRQIVSVLPDGAGSDGMSCSEIRVSPDGKFVYTANRDTSGKGRDSLSVLAIGDKGELRLLQNVPAEVDIPRNINLTPDGKWLLVAGQKDGGVPVFAIDENGKLKFSGNRAEIANAMCIVFAPMRGK